MALTSVRVFNLACYAVALLWLVGASAATRALRTNPMDFDQYYMGGVVARHAAWDSLYPVPLADRWRNPGQQGESTLPPRYEQLRQEHGAGGYTRFIQPPPMALLLTPLSLLEFQAAVVVWAGLSGFFGWLIAMQAGAIFQRLKGPEPTRWRGVVTLVVGLSPMLFLISRAGQVSSFVGCCIGVMVLDLLAHRPLCGAVALVTGALAKYATLVLLPLHVVMGRWRTLLLGVAVGAGVLAGSLAIMGTGPFKVFLSQIAPLLGRSDDERGNQSIEGVLLHNTTRQPLAPAVRTEIRAASLLVLIALVWGILRSRREFLQRPDLLVAAAAALVSWLLVFSPIGWYHYYAYLMPFWGWLAWMWGRSRASSAAVLGIVALNWVPLCAQTGLRLPEPLRSHVLAGNLLLMGLAMAHILKASRQRI